MLDDERCEVAEIRRPRMGDPAHDGMWVRLELREERTQEAAPCDTAVMGPQHAAHRFAAEPCAAAFVRDRKAPAADAMMPPADDAPADASGPDGDDSPIAPAVRADACRMRVRRDPRLAERQHTRAGPRKIGGLGRAGERQAGYRPLQIRICQTGMVEALHTGLQHRGEAFLDAKADVGRPGAALPEDQAGWLG